MVVGLGLMRGDEAPRVEHKVALIWPRVADIAEPVVVSIRLIGVGALRAIIEGVSDQVTVRVDEGRGAYVRVTGVPSDRYARYARYVRVTGVPRELG